MQTNTLIRYLTTLLLLALAVWLGKALWDHYMHSPWTRDGRVRADVITLSADVAGLVTQVAVKDNQPVHKGDVLFVVDRVRYAAALAQAEAALDGQRTEKNRRGKEAARRDSLDSAVVSAENRETASFAAAAAGSQYQAALAARDLARLNLERTVVRAPADGYVTNLNVHVGDFAAVGAPKLALIDRNSYRVEGYFEETKLPAIRIGSPAEVRIMGQHAPLHGHVQSIAAGIEDQDRGIGPNLLPRVNPTFNWVRLAQRIPVRIALDQVPPEVRLVAGQTATVSIRDARP